MLLSAGSIIQKGVTSTTSKYMSLGLASAGLSSTSPHVGCRFAGIASKRLSLLIRRLRNASCLMNLKLCQSLFQRVCSNGSLADFAILQLI
ncbi:hypothetical protein DA89_921 [Vibrio paracholerae]|nr:hypothetical protein DA89_921 [Vibrio paracholerae]